jgi:predicted O-methyltransferase YrrM
LKKRLNLFVYGDRDGVSLNFLEKSTNGIFQSLENLLDFESEIPKEAHQYFSAARSLFKETLINQSSITSKRWNAEENLFVLLYSLVRSNKSKFVVETGVANGITTNAIMNALQQASKDGELHSFDVLPEARNAYSGPGNWNFHLLPAKNTARKIKGIVSKFSKVDIWVHDSDHGYRWQKFEYLLALASLSDNGILISDDIDASSAWGELAKTHFRKSFIIFDSRRFIGIALK